MERPLLRPLPLDPFEIAVWKRARVHPDNYVQFGRQFFSVPHTVGNVSVWIRATDKILTIYDDNRQLIKQHLITAAKRHTDWNDFSENVQAVLHEDTYARLIAIAARVGPHFRKLIKALLANHAFLNLRRAQGLIRLLDTNAREQLEGAAAYLLARNISPSVKTMRRLLENPGDYMGEPDASTDEPTPAIGEQTRSFIRSADYFINP